MNAARLDMAQRAVDLRAQRKTYTEIARELNCGRGKVAGLIRDYRRYQDKNPVVINAAALHPAIMLALYRQSAITADDYGQIADDSDLWQAAHAELKKRGMIAVMLLPDLHLDDTDWQAVEMHLQVARYHRPDLILFGGDTFDLAAISRWNESRHSRRKDAFKSMYRPWKHIIDGLQSASPGSKFLILPGNHDARADAAADEFPALGDTIEEEFAQLCRCDNRVMWLRGVQEVNIGPYFFQHGTRVGENAPKNALKDLGWGQSSGQGHSHTPSVYIHKAKVPGSDRYRIVTAVAYPHSQNTPPAYTSHRTRQAPRWITGTGMVYINMHGDDVHQSPILYHRRADGSYAAQSGRKTFIQPSIEGKSWPPR